MNAGMLSEVQKANRPQLESLIYLHDYGLVAKITPSNYFASHSPVASSQKPSRSSSFCGGALKRGDDGEP